MKPTLVSVLHDSTATLLKFSAAALSLICLLSTPAALADESGPQHSKPLIKSPDFAEKKLTIKKKYNADLSKQAGTTAIKSRAIAPAAGQPAGLLANRIVFTSGGHGWTYDNDPDDGIGPAWRTQRGVTEQMNEDYGNLDQMTLFTYYCFNAGAVVCPMRPVGNQTNEVVMDNDSAGVTFSGTWSTSTSTIFYGSAGDVPYKFASIAATETATATYTPTFPVAGFYPVYCWTRHGSDRTSQLYKINHTGGQASVRIPHHRVGNGWVYLGTYYFNAGANAATGAVIISNLQPTPTVGSVALADAIRFGNGMGDVVPTPENSETTRNSDYPREEECSRYWVQRSLGQGQSAVIYAHSGNDKDDNVSTPSRMAAEMNREADGNMFQRVYIGFHSNAGGGRGCVGLYNNESLFPGSATPNQLRLAQIVGGNLEVDMLNLSSLLEVPWFDKSYNTYARSDYAFGEINDSVIGGEFDAIIIEVAFHDDPDDAKIMRDSKARDWISRSVYHSVVKYFNEFDSLPLSMIAEPPVSVRAIANSAGIKVTWAAGPAQGGSSTATNYVVYRSTNGFGFGNPVFVTDAKTYTFTTLPNDVAHYFRVAAVNAGGESLPSDTVGCRRSANQSTGGVLIVNGFDRFGRTTNLRQTPASLNYLPPGNSGTMDRVLPRSVNSFDYVVQTGNSVSAYGMPFDSCQNETITNATISMTNYPIVIWQSGNESTGDETFSASEQGFIQAFLTGGGSLFASGSEIGWDLDRASGPTAADRAFYNNYLHADFGSNTNDSSGNWTLAPIAGALFAGNGNAAFDDGNKEIYWVAAPDILTPFGTGASAIGNYNNGSGAGAIQYDGSAGGGKVVYFGFPFETMTAATKRDLYMADILGFLRINTAPTLAAIGNQTVDEGTALTFTASATDIDAPANTLTFTLDAGAPAGASINSTSGAFTWTPTGAQGPGVYSITVRVTDNGSPALNDFETITVTVNDLNVAPVLAAIGNQTANEATALTFTASATDPGSTLTYTLDAGAPGGASINSASGAFSWTPTEAEGPGVYSITVRVTDDGSPALDDFETISVTVNEVNVAPVLAAIGNKTVNEASALTFGASATDADSPANTLTYSLDAGAPAGAGINSASGAFSWTPTEAQGPGPFSITVRVTDNGSPVLDDFETITVTVNEVNVAPVLAAIGNKTVSETTALTFTASATDADAPANTLAYSLDAGAPSGATINATTGAFSWTPTGSQGGSAYSITVRVTDNGSPALDDFETISVTVNDVNVAPVLGAIGNKTVNEGVALTFTASATDSDVPANTLTFSLDAGAPAGATVNATTGAFSWTPTESQGGSAYSITVRVTDNGSPAFDDFETINVTVNDVNVAPVLGAIGNKTVNEGVALTFTASATDSDVPANTLTFSLDAGAPAGATVNATTGAFSWTPTESQGGSAYSITVRVTDNGSPALNDFETISVTVNEVNVAPVVTLGTASVSETFVNFETFASGTANGTVMFRQPSYSSSTSAHLNASPNLTSATNTYPAGHTSTRVLKASFNYKTGTTNPWLRLTTVDTANVPNPTIYVNQKVRVKMNSDKALKVALGIRETATSAAIGGNGGTTGTIEFVGATNVVGNSPFPNRTVAANTWTTLEWNLPTEPVRAFTGDGILPASGKGTIEHLALVPAGGTGTYNVWMDNFEVVSSASLSSTTTIYTGNIMTFTASATDADVPANTRTFSLDAGAPSGATINATSGAFTWTATAGQAGTTNTITVRATDNGIPVMSGTKVFTVIVLSDPLGVQSSEGWVSSRETVTLSWNAEVGKAYRIQFKNSLALDWADLKTVTATRTEESITVDNGGDGMFYRIIEETSAGAAE